MPAERIEAYQFLAEIDRFSAYREVATEVLRNNNATLHVAEGPIDLYDALGKVPNTATHAVVFVDSTYHGTKTPYNLARAIRKAYSGPDETLKLISLDLPDNKHFDAGLERDIRPNEDVLIKWGRQGLEQIIKEQCTPFANPRLFKPKKYVTWPTDAKSL